MATDSGFVYVAFVIDVFARRIVGWKVSSAPNTALVLDAVEQAIRGRMPGREAALIHDSDRVVQYLSFRYAKRLSDAEITPSVGRVGDSYELKRCFNAMAETVIGLFKTEVIRQAAPWRGVKDVEFATLERVGWLNHWRSICRRLNLRACMMSKTANQPSRHCTAPGLQRKSGAVHHIGYI